jgi:uncharacterized protein (TIGR03067 family)
MKPFACRTLVLLALIPIAASATQGDTTKKDDQLLQGSWKVIAAEQGGKPEQTSVGGVFSFANGKMTAKKNGKLIGDGTYQLAPAKSPKWIDVTLTFKASGRKHVYQGIYEVKGDTLKMCHGAPGGERPSRFAAPADTPDWVLATLQREKN